MQEENSEKEVFVTPVFNKAAWLVMNGCNLIDIDKTNRGRMIFVFEETEELKKIHDDFWRQEQIQRLIEAQQLLKTRMYADNPPLIFKKEKNVQEVE